MVHWRADDAVTTVGAVGAVWSPWWLPELHTVSQLAAEVAPILGAIWLTLKIANWLYETRKKAKFRQELMAHINKH